jgi:hypothetical protein
MAAPSCSLGLGLGAAIAEYAFTAATTAPSPTSTSTSPTPSSASASSPAPACAFSCAKPRLHHPRQQPRLSRPRLARPRAQRHPRRRRLPGLRPRRRRRRHLLRPPRRRSGRAVLNAGVPTYGPREYLATARELLAERKVASVVVVLNFVNDPFELERPNRERHAVWDGWAVRSETAPAASPSSPAAAGCSPARTPSTPCAAGCTSAAAPPPPRASELDTPVDLGTPSEGGLHDLVLASQRAHADALERSRRGPPGSLQGAAAPRRRASSAASATTSSRRPRRPSSPLGPRDRPRPPRRHRQRGL